MLGPAPAPSAAAHDVYSVAHVYHVIRHSESRPNPAHTMQRASNTIKHDKNLNAANTQKYHRAPTRSACVNQHAITNQGRW